MDTSALSNHDLFENDEADTWVAFRVPYFGSYIEVVTFYVEEGHFRLASSSAVPRVEDVVAFAEAFGRCQKFIADNKLIAGRKPA